MELDPEIKLITGTISFEDLEGGYWALTDAENNEKYLVIEIPDDLKTEGLKIAAIGQEFSNEMSIYMVGKAVKLIQYRILS
jgi:hypothetical protein